MVGRAGRAGAAGGVASVAWRACEATPSSPKARTFHECVRFYRLLSRDRTRINKRKAGTIRWKERDPPQRREP